MLVSTLAVLLAALVIVLLPGPDTLLIDPRVGVFVTFLPGFIPHGYPVAPTALLATES